MEKKDLLSFALIIVFSVISLYMRYVKKKKNGISGFKMRGETKSGLSGQPDDYEPYSKK